jgi:hypothetical protein
MLMGLRAQTPSGAAIASPPPAADISQLGMMHAHFEFCCFAIQIFKDS